MFWLDANMKVVCYVGIFLAVLTVSDAEECRLVEQCKCQTSSRTIDVNTVKPPDNTGWFTANDPKSSDVFYFSPCSRLDLKQVCTILSGSPDTSICQYRNLGQQYDVGNTPGNFSGDPSSETLTMTYTGDSRQSIVKLKCNSNSYLEFINELPLTYYNFVLYSPVTCQSSKPGGLSVGSILVILFFVILIVYCIAGVLFMKFVRHAEGTEMIPNYDFWKELPKLIKDGFLFTFRGCKGESTYQRI